MNIDDLYICTSATRRYTLPKEMYYCSFCGKSQYEVHKLIGGPTVFICNECVEMCVVVCQEDDVADEAAVREWARHVYDLGRRT